ncbi:hypothetical protein E2320_006242 [Naja naja]|nr:hypothetical protein E2320_006242 [Naja naja]
MAQVDDDQRGNPCYITERESDAGHNPALTASEGHHTSRKQTQNPADKEQPYIKTRVAAAKEAPATPQSSSFALVRSMPLTSSQDVCKAPESSLRQKRGLAEAGKV